MTDETKVSKRVDVDLPNFKGKAGCVFNGDNISMAYTPTPGQDDLVPGKTYEIDGKQAKLVRYNVSDYVKGMMVYELVVA